MDNQEEIKALIKQELPNIIQDREIRGLILQTVVDYFAGKQETESRFDQVLEELRRDRLEQSGVGRPVDPVVVGEIRADRALGGLAVTGVAAGIGPQSLALLDRFRIAGIGIFVILGETRHRRN